MKKLVLLIIVGILNCGITTAQNANRSGFFMELGIGGLVGNTPRTSISVVDNIVFSKCLSGSVVDFGLGARIRMSNHWSYEVKAESQIPLNNPVNALVGRFLPIGFRYTSSELWRNYSWYAHFDLGGAITVNRGVIGLGNINLDDTVIGPSSTEADYMDIKGYVGLEGYGTAYSLGIGVNLTTHLYIEGAFGGQMIFKGFGKNGLGLLNYGTVSGIVGYRF